MPESEPTPVASVLQDPKTYSDLDDWGPIPDMIEGQSHTYGTLLHRGPNGDSECGIWECTPGHWECEVERNEFCHFLDGCATYVPDNGDVIEVREGTIAFFPAGWAGTCEVHDTVRKVYLCR